MPSKLSPTVWHARFPALSWLSLSNPSHVVSSQSNHGRVPRAVWEPFKKPSDSASSRTLRPLSKLFTGKHALPAFKLSPRTFTNIVSILLHAGESTGQQRLLHTFISALRTWKDDDAAVAACKRCNVDGIDSDRLLQLRDTLSQNLVRSVIIPLQNQSIGLRARWFAAQILATVVRDDPTARHQMITNSDCTPIGLLVRDHDDYVLRFLVADILRELLVGDVDRKACWPSGSAQHFVDSFPTERHVTPTWLSHIQDYLSDVDKAMAFRDPRQSVFRAKRCFHWKDDGTTVDGKALEDGLIILSYQINCIIPDQARGLVLVEYPIFSQEMMTVKHVPSSNGEPPVLTMEYLEDKGFEVIDGARAAVCGIKFELADGEDATIILQALQNLQTKADTNTDVDSAPIDADVTNDQHFRKRSVALVGLESPRSQYSPEAGDQLGDAAGQSDTQTMTPLERKAQQRLGDHGIDQLLDQTTISADSEDVVQRASMNFQERLRASHEPHSKQGPGRSPRAQTEASKTLGLAGLKSINTAQSRSLGSADRAAPPKATSHHATSPKAPRLKQGSTISKSLQKQKLSPATKLTAMTHERSAHLKDTSEEPKTQGSVPATRKTRSSGLVLSEISSKNTIKPKEIHAATPSGKSQLHRLKRPKPARHSSQDAVDWDEDIRDGKEYDLPEDDDDDDDTVETHPTKRTKLDPKKTSRKPAPTKHSKTTSSKRFKKPALPIKSNSKATKGRTTGRDKTTTVVEETLATRRSRRSQKALLYDDPEDSGSQISSPGEQQHNQPAKLQRNPQQKSSPAEPLRSDGAKSGLEPGNTISATSRSSLKSAKKQEGSQDAGSSAELPIEFSDDSSPAPAHDPESSKPTHQPRNPEDVNGAALPAGADGIVAEEAQDSHPMAKADVDATAASAKNNFELQLEDYIRDPPPAPAGKGKHSAEQTTPFGDRAQFLANVNALKSTTPKGKRQSTQTPTPSVAAAQSASKFNSEDELSVVSHNGHPKMPFEERETLRRKSPVPLKSTEQSTEHFNGGESETLVLEATGSEQQDEGLLDLGHEDPNIHYEEPSAGARQLESDANVLTQGNEAMHIRSTDAKPTEISEIKPAVESSATQPTLGDLKRQQAPRGNAQRDQPAKKMKAQPNLSGAEVWPAESGNEKGAGLNARHSLPDLSKRADKQLTRAVIKPSNKRLSTTGVTPTGRSNARRLSDLPPTSEKAASRTPIIHFGKEGPKNQGRPTDSFVEPDLRPSSVPRQTTNHEIFKRSADRDSLPVEDTPSYISGQIYAELEADEEQAGLSGVLQHSNSEDDVVHDNGANNGDGDYVDEAYDEGQAYDNVPSLDQSVPATDPLPPEQVDIEEAIASKPDVGELRATSRSLVDEAPDEIRPRPLSNPESSEAEASDHGHSDFDNCHTEPIHAAQAEVQATSVIDRPQKPLSGHSSTQQPRAGAPQGSEKSSRQSIGIAELLHHAFPEAQQAIATSSFRTQTRKEDVRKGRSMAHKPAVSTINPNPVYNTVTTALKQQGTSIVGSEITAKRPQIADVATDQKSMPPPPPKASNSRKLANAGSDVASILKKNPIYENPRTAKSREPEPAASPEPKQANNSDASMPVLGERPEVLGSTPEPFHTKLEDDIRQAEEARERRDTSICANEDSHDRTLVNDDSGYAGVLLDRPVFRSLYEPPASTNDKSSAAGDEDTIGYGRDQAAWRSGTRGPHRGLFDVVMQITKVSLPLV